MESFRGEMQNAAPGMVSPSTPEKWDLLHHFISKRWSKRWLWITSHWSFPSWSQAKGLNPSAKSSFAAANTAAYYSLICPDPSLMQDSLRLEQRMGGGGGAGGNNFIISAAPPGLSWGIWKANSRQWAELLGLMNRWLSSRRPLPFPEPLHQLGAKHGITPRMEWGKVAGGGGDCSPWKICSPFALRGYIDQVGD